ncbi:hypothetical protein AOL_s00080g343 [Orbilia oligospora ATCC 24927]|uniref:Uncharacterized protein n=1 Tax=Arthrobotrys oligospora (strain ATCC 24927 / CBS 115.81 / DSM 1491) TaxID=756982 RepID=G1XEV8_ARTOA|nr:hypothetical protein AOL_s00080g343 [Orbilia oligospora ATCC 24927]EGX48218.1 hypothetical protein AOL_s00080g343 [Orbilia oligospora ATCC 24927]
MEAMDFVRRAIEPNENGWPFGTNGLKSGQWRSNHTSTVSIVYDQPTILVPWPWLLVSFTLSFLVALWGYYSTLKQRNEARGENLRAKITLTILLLTTVRSIATFILTIKTFLPEPNRYPPASAIAALFISTLSSALDCGLLSARFYGAVFKRIAQLNAWITFASVVMTFILPFVKGAFEYGYYSLTGGNCPVAVWMCPLQPSVVGCPDDFATRTNSQRAEFWGATVRNVDNLALTVTFTSPSELALAVLAILLGAYITISGFHLISQTRDLIEYVWNYRQEVERKKAREQEANSEELYFVGSLKREKPKAPIRKDASVFILLSILVFTFVSVPLHAYQESKPKDIIIVDGFGKKDTVRKESAGPKFREQVQKQISGENTDASSWVDCYTLGAPSSKDGFMKTWIELQKREPLTFLAML